MAQVSVKIPAGMATKEAKRMAIAGAKRNAACRYFGVPDQFSGEYENVTMSLDALDVSIFKDIGKRSGVSDVSVGDVVTGVLWREYLFRIEAPREKTLDAYIDKAGLEFRQAQQITEEGIYTALTGNAINMIEAPTGSGKTIAMLSAAIDFAKKYPNEKTAIGVPTLALMEQVAMDVEDFVSYGLIKKEDIAFIVGKSEFASELALKRMIELIRDENSGMEEFINHKMLHACEMVEHWMAKQRDPGWYTHHAAHIPPWSLDDLNAHLDVYVEFFPQCELIGSDKEDAGYIAYRNQFARAEHAKIMVVTHTMLALDNKLRKALSAMDVMQAAGGKRETLIHFLEDEGRGVDVEQMADLLLKDKEAREALLAFDQEAQKNVSGKLVDELQKQYFKWFALQQISALQQNDRKFILPNFSRLVLDEGHQFESSFARIMGESVSFHALLSDKTLTQEDVRVLKKLLKPINQYADSLQEDANAMRVTVGVPEIRAALQSIDEYLNGKPGKNGILKAKNRRKRLSAQVRSAAYGIRIALENYDRPMFIAEIDYSPVRRYPRLRVGKVSVFNDMRFIWQRIQGAAVISASLQLPSTNNAPFSYMSTVLGLNKLVSNEIIVPKPKWLTEPVTLFMPEQVTLKSVIGGKDRFWLQPPSSEDLRKGRWATLFSAWMDEVNEVAQAFIRETHGGSLILVSSYEKAEVLSSRMHAEFGDRLIVANRETPFSVQKEQYVSRYYDGVKPIWIAVGSAWTGLDLNAGGNPEDDCLLETLIIPSLPFGMNQTATHESRVKKFGYGAVVNEMLLSLKQGLGRLVRRNGIPHNRKLVLLDTRLYNKQTLGGSGGLDSLNALLSDFKRVPILRE